MTDNRQVGDTSVFFQSSAISLSSAHRAPNKTLQREAWWRDVVPNTSQIVGFIPSQDWILGTHLTAPQMGTSGFMIQS